MASGRRAPQLPANGFWNSGIKGTGTSKASGGPGFERSVSQQKSALAAKGRSAAVRRGGAPKLPEHGFHNSPIKGTGTSKRSGGPGFEGGRGGMGKGIKHRPSGSPRGGQFY